MFSVFHLLSGQSIACFMSFVLYLYRHMNEIQRNGIIINLNSEFKFGLGDICLKDLSKFGTVQIKILVI